MKILLAVILSLNITLSFSRSLSDVGNTAKCIKQCRPNIILTTLNIGGKVAKSLSSSACKVSCSNKCFANEMNNGRSSTEFNTKSEAAAVACHDSLAQDFHMK